MTSGQPRLTRFALAGGFILMAAVIAGASAFAGARLAAGSNGAPQAVRAAAASVVTIYAERPVAGLTPFDPGAGPEPQAQTVWRWRSASGFAFAPEGWIVTNHHAIAEARSVQARLADGRRVSAEVRGVDPRRDIAVLRLADVALPPLSLAASIETGDPVYALGAPFGLAGSLSAGIVSGFDRAYDGIDPIGYLQHDAALNPGNSGGPLLDGRGYVVGLNTAIAEPAIMNVGVSFAIPGELVFEIAEQLRREGEARPARLGVTVRSLDQALAQAIDLQPGTGLILDSVQAGSPAQTVGLTVGDVLLSVDGAAMVSPRDLNRALLGRRQGGRVDLILRRGGTRLEIAAVLDVAPDGPIPTEVGGAQGAAQEYGLGFADGEPAGRGVLVEQVRPGSPASRAGLRPGDRVVAINGRAPADGIEARLRLEEAGPAAAIRVLHQGETSVRHLGLARAASQALSAPSQRWPDAAGGPY